jgi:hypothetical protein
VFVRGRLKGTRGTTQLPNPQQYAVCHSRLDDNVEAAAVALTVADLGEIENAGAHIQVQGARYLEYLQRLIDR